MFPRERLVQRFITDQSLTLASQSGEDYTILIIGDFVIDHTTLSTNEVRREKEAFVLYIDGDVSALSFDAIAEVLQQQFQGAQVIHKHKVLPLATTEFLIYKMFFYIVAVGSVQAVGRTLDFSNAMVDVVQTELVFSVVEQ